jgi:hypothetical protein
LYAKYLECDYLVTGLKPGVVESGGRYSMGCRFSLLSAYTGIEKYLNKNQSLIKWIKHESNQIKHGLNKNQCF